MAKAIKLRTDGHIDIIDVPQQRSLLDWFYLQIGTNIIENVYPRGLEEPYMMVMDEEALLSPPSTSWAPICTKRRSTGTRSAARCW